MYDYDEETYNIWHLMIDESMQRRGYGKGEKLEVWIIG